MKGSDAIFNALSGIDMFKNMRDDRKVPIRKGCLAAKMGGCFCTGACKEIIGWRDKLPGEI